MRILVLGNLFSNLNSFADTIRKCEVFGEQTPYSSWSDTTWQKHVVAQLDDVEPDLLVLDPKFASSWDVYDETIAGFLFNICSRQLDDGRHILFLDLG